MLLRTYYEIANMSAQQLNKLTNTASALSGDLESRGTHGLSLFSIPFYHLSW
jgi:hypothetical protein